MQPLDLFELHGDLYELYVFLAQREIPADYDTKNCKKVMEVLNLIETLR